MEVDDDCDEDVIFENSPLYQHLKEAGLADIDVEPIRSVRSVSLHPEVPQDSSPTQHRGQPKASTVTRLCQKCRDYITSLFHGRQGDNTITRVYQQKVLKKLCSAPILVEEDRDFLEDFVVEDVSDRGKKTPSKLWPWIKFMFPTVLLPCFLAALTARVISPDTSSCLVSDVGLCMMGVVGVVSTSVAARDHRRKRYYEGSACCLTDFVNRTHHLVTLARKSLRLIQETELVARGFTLVSQKTAVSQLDQKPSMSTLRQCPELRRYLFNMARSSTLELREATLALIKIHPLIPEIDSISHYLCGISLEEYGPCLSHPHPQPPREGEGKGEGGEGEGELYNLTDGYSVAALKAMTELFSLHLSEFGRRLALCFSTQSQPADREKQDPFQTEDITTALHEKLKCKELTLNRLYDFHKSSPQGRQPKLHTIPKKCTSQTQEFYIAVHSLDLHLQAAISRVRDLASELETKIEEQTANQNEDLKESSNQKWESFMSGVKAELEACRGCWEEGMSRLEKSKKKVPKLDSPADVVPKADQPRPVVFADVGDPIIEDQVFEGYTDPDEVEAEPWGWEPILSLEEREKKKREKQEALRLLTELKSVITVRAQDRERREQVALHRMRQGKTTLVQSDQSECTEGGASESKTQISDNSSTLNVDLKLDKTRADLGYGDSDSCGQQEKQRHIKSLGLELNHDGLESELIRNSDLCTQEDAPTVRIMERDCQGENSSGEQLSSKGQVVQNDAHIGQSEFKMEPVSERDVQNNGTKMSPNSSSTSDLDSPPQTKQDLSDIDIPSSTSIDVSSTPSKVQTARDPERSELKERLERLHGSHLGFTANVAAMAAARSAHLGLSEQTFGDTFGDSSSGGSEDDT